MRTIGILLLTLLLVISCDDGTDSLGDEIKFVVTGNEFESEDNYTIFYFEFTVYPGDSFGSENFLCSEGGVPFKYIYKLFNGDVVIQYPSYMRLITTTAQQPCENCAMIEPDEYIRIRTINNEQQYTQFTIRFVE